MLEIRERLLREEAIVINEIIESVDVISQLGGITIYENGAMEFRGVQFTVITQPTARTVGQVYAKSRTMM